MHRYLRCFLARKSASRFTRPSLDTTDLFCSALPALIARPIPHRPFRFSRPAFFCRSFFSAITQACLATTSVQLSERKNGLQKHGAGQVASPLAFPPNELTGQKQSYESIRSSKGGTGCLTAALPRLLERATLVAIRAGRYRVSPDHDVRYRSGFAVSGVGAAILKLFGTVGFAGQSFTIMTSFSSRCTAEFSIVRSTPLFTSLTKGRHPIGKASG